MSKWFEWAMIGINAWTALMVTLLLFKGYQGTVVFGNRAEDDTR